MKVLKDMEPQVVLDYFETICSIPHGSGNEKALSDYLVNFANERGLKSIQDDSYNVIIMKDGSAGYEDSEPVIIQGHIDMVCEKNEGVDFDFTKDGIKLIVEDGLLKADGTTLGADNGIAVAMMLAVLDSKDMPHPPIEAVFTTDEETGLFGAEAIDVSMLKGKKFINMDSEDEGIFTVSCAGGITAISTIPCEREEAEGEVLNIKISGLLGGHSGIEINKERANANLLLGRLLFQLSKKVDFKLISAAGGRADNVITKEAVAKILVSDAKAATDEIEAIFHNIKHEYRVSDPDILIAATSEGSAKVNALTAAATANVVNYIFNFPYGIVNMSIEMEGLVETSLNLGILNLDDAGLSTTAGIRSAVDSRIHLTADKVVSHTMAAGGTVELDGYYPGWEYKADSQLRDLAIEIFKKQYGKEPVIEAIHAGLECGMFAEKIEDLDAISIGPDLRNVHTPDEYMDIESARRVWEFLVELLKESK